MKEGKFKGFYVLFVLVFFIILSSCKAPDNILKSSSEVDFSTQKKVQILFNEHIYDTTIVFNNSKLEINFDNKKDLTNGACICVENSNYKITYKDMVFKGETDDLLDTFLPCILYDFLVSFGNEICFEEYDKDRECFYLKKNINGHFVLFECYETENSASYSIEIK